MTGKTINLQDSILNQVRKDGIMVTIHLVNGFQIKGMVKGLMIESYIEEGCQAIGDGIYGKSITDPCLGWEDSKKLIYDIAENC